MCSFSLETESPNLLRENGGIKINASIRQQIYSSVHASIRWSLPLSRQCSFGEVLIGPGGRRESSSSPLGPFAIVSYLTDRRGRRGRGRENQRVSDEEDEERDTGGITMLGHLVGLVKVRVLRGVNLAIRDLRSSDPYVVIRMGKQVRWGLDHTCCFMLGRPLRRADTNCSADLAC